MTTQELEAAILEGVQDIYKKKYVGRLKVQELPSGYQMKMWLNHPEAPLVIAAELSDEKFVSFILKELRSRHLELTEYFTGYKIEDPHNNCDNTTSCCDKRRTNR